MARLLIERTVFTRITTQLQKAEHAATREMLGLCRQSQSPSHDVIVWEPSTLLLASLQALLEHELGYVRKPESPGALRLKMVLKRVVVLLHGGEQRPAGS